MVPESENPQVFSPAELGLLHKLDCSIENASLETKEFALYSVLGTLLGMYADSFAVFTGLDYRVFVHTIPQDTLTGCAWIQLGAGRRSFQAIPDMTVRITRLHQDQEKRAHNLVLTIEAKRLVGTCGSMHSNYDCGFCLVIMNPFFSEFHTDGAKLRAVEVFPKHLPQLMFQAFSAWSESHEQPCIYVGILIGPYLTVLVFNHPPSHDSNDLPSSVLTPPCAHPEDNDVDNDEPLYMEKDESIGIGGDELIDVESDESLYPEGQHLCDAFPLEHAPQLVIFMEHIFKEPGDWRAGLSAPLQYIFHLATTDIIKSFEPDIIQEPSNIFTFAGPPQTHHNVTTFDQVGVVIITHFSLEPDTLTFIDNLQCIHQGLV